MRKNNKKIKGTTFIEEALNTFSNKCNENKELIERTKKITSLIDLIVERRKALGLIQRDLATLTKFKQPMIARIEKCECMPRLDTLIRILDWRNLDIHLIEMGFNKKIIVMMIISLFNNLVCY